MRYHAAHHLFPSMPYHNIRIAHERLMKGLPAGSPYRATVESSIWAVICNLIARARSSAARTNEIPPSLVPEGAEGVSSRARAA
jgi:fatty acid desaturase